MRITELLKKESIELGVKVSDKEEAVDRLVSLMDAGGRLKDTAGYKEGILAREALGSTAMRVDGNFAIPAQAKVRGGKGSPDWRPWWFQRALITTRLTAPWPTFCL